MTPPSRVTAPPPHQTGEECLGTALAILSRAATMTSSKFGRNNDGRTAARPLPDRHAGATPPHHRTLPGGRTARLRRHLRAEPDGQHVDVRGAVVANRADCF